eukprot:scaffold34651_cov152-Isochrysis_galbana.AAC.1
MQCFRGPRKYASCFVAKPLWAMPVSSRMRALGVEEAPGRPTDRICGRIRKVVRCAVSSMRHQCGHFSWQGGQLQLLNLGRGNTVIP